MFKKCNVIILPGERKLASEEIVKSMRYPDIIQRFGSFENSYEDECKFYHLYVTSDEEIEDGDWFIRNKEIYQCFKVSEEDIEFKTKKDSVYCGNNTFWNKKDCHKIIASIDSSLGKYIKGNHPIYGEWIGVKLPSPSQQFIEEYITNYNKGNKIEDVMVEYNTMNKVYDSKSDVPYQKIEILKINYDNTITIQRSKESWNREELQPILLKLCHDVNDYISDPNRLDFNINKWINENL